MLNIIEENRLFFRLYFFIFFIVFVSQYNEPTLTATLFFSNHRSDFGDAFFTYWTLLGEELPYVGLFLFFIFYKKNKTNAHKILLTGITVLIIAVVLKEIFEAPRPATIIEKMGLLPSFHFVKGVELLRGATSFPSGHTASAFAVWGITAFQFSKNTIIQISLFFIALLVGVSRVYLAQHFPEDTLFGSAIGLMIAISIEYFFSKKQSPSMRPV